MAVTIPYVRDIKFKYGVVDQVTPLIRRVIAENPGGFTYTGTGTYIIGHGELAVVDPGPMIDAHIEALFKAIEGEKVTHIFVTHHHSDHSPASVPLKAKTGAKIYGYGAPRAGHNKLSVKVEEDEDTDFVPDMMLKHGDIVKGKGWTMEAVFTPGHTSNHMCYALKEEKALFTGDHIMGWSTSVIAPPDGDMHEYMDSLRLLLERDDEIYWPTHGPAITEPKPFVRAYIAHREERERQILQQIAVGHRHIKEMVPVIYAAVDKGLHAAAAQSVLAHLKYLQEQGRVVSNRPADIDAEYRLP